jgi:hypothetical protein
MNALEAVADAIMHYEGWFAGSRANRNRNPGNLRDSPYKNSEDPQGYAVFDSLSSGYEALLHDLEVKFSGRSHSGLTPDSTLLDLFEVYAPSADRNNPSRYADFVADWISHALNRTFTVDSHLRDVWTPTGEV